MRRRRCNVGVVDVPRFGLMTLFSDVPRTGVRGGLAGRSGEEEDAIAGVTVVSDGRRGVEWRDKGAEGGRMKGVLVEKYWVDSSCSQGFEVSGDGDGGLNISRRSGDSWAVEGRLEGADGDEVS
jgi:hypothetical protein